MLWRYSEMSEYPWTFSHGPGQPDAIARELKYHGSCCARYTMTTERLWTTCWMVTDSAKKRKMEEQPRMNWQSSTVLSRYWSWNWSQDNDCCSILCRISSKQEWSHIIWGSIRNGMPSNNSLMATWFFLFLIYYLTSRWQFMPKWEMHFKINSRTEKARERGLGDRQIHVDLIWNYYIRRREMSGLVYARMLDWKLVRLCMWSVCWDSRRNNDVLVATRMTGFGWYKLCEVERRSCLFHSLLQTA